MDNEKRARLLQFVCGTCKVPVGGFAELMGIQKLLLSLFFFFALFLTSHTLWPVIMAEKK